MRAFLLSALVLFACLFSFSQEKRASLPPSLTNLAVPVMQSTPSERIPFIKAPSGPVANSSYPEDTIGNTKQFLQTNGSSPAGRLAGFPDGTYSAVWTFANIPDDPNRGTGYNYFNGSTWNPWPENAVEQARTGWPSIARWGPQGEIILAHRGATAKPIISRRTQKGSGTWITSELPLPAGASGLLWPRMVSGGNDHNTIHIIGLSSPVGNGGTLFHGQDGALLYYRSLDGGASWVDQGTLLPGTDSSFYTEFESDTYAFAEPHGSKLAIVAGYRWYDLFALVSEDGGATWQKQLIWEHPYPFWDGEETDTLYCPDGALHCAFDANGDLHVVFGITRVYSVGDYDEFHFPFVDGIAHWKQGMPAWTGGDQLNCLDPENLLNQGRLIGYMQDVNGNGTIDLIADSTGLYADYYVGASSCPQISFDAQGRGFLVYSSLSEGYNLYGMDFRHLWVRGSADNGTSWQPFLDLSADPVLGQREHIQPVVCSNPEMADWSLTYYQSHNPDVSTFFEMYVDFFRVSKLICGTDETASPMRLNIYPNPASSLVHMDLDLPVPMDVNITLTDLGGRMVTEQQYRHLEMGRHTLGISRGDLPPGIYILRVRQGNQAYMSKLVFK